MCSPGINGEGELREQPANPGSPGKMAVKTECVCSTQKAPGQDSDSIYDVTLNAMCTELLSKQPKPSRKCTPAL